METILEINDYSSTDGWGGEEGFEIITTEQSIKLAIDSFQSCCEDWGYFMSEDYYQDFVGAILLDIQVTDTALNKQKLTNVYEGGIMFVDLITDRGVLQFVAYNEHNGYYGHDARVESKQLTHWESL